MQNKAYEIRDSREGFDADAAAEYEAWLDTLEEGDWYDDAEAFGGEFFGHYDHF